MLGLKLIHVSKRGPWCKAGTIRDHCRLYMGSNDGSFLIMLDRSVALAYCYLFIGGMNHFSFLILSVNRYGFQSPGLNRGIQSWFH